MDRPLFNPPVRPDITDAVVAASGEDIPADALFNGVYVDKERLVWRIRKELQHRVQVSLSEILAVHPLEQGLAELVAYLGLASEDAAALIDDRKHQSVAWTDEAGRQREATLPLIIFARAEPAAVEVGGRRA
jgi:hypothetical protein